MFESDPIEREDAEHEGSEISASAPPAGQEVRLDQPCRSCVRQAGRNFTFTAQVSFSGADSPSGLRLRVELRQLDSRSPCPTWLRKFFSSSIALCFRVCLQDGKPADQLFHFDKPTQNSIPAIATSGPLVGSYLLLQALFPIQHHGHGRRRNSSRLRRQTVDQKLLAVGCNIIARDVGRIGAARNGR